jgi:F420-dependent oxidoreductase-like protein
MRVCLMIEGQQDVTWEQWCALADACESSGIEGLFRSDHYLAVLGGGNRSSLDAWTTLAALAARTSRIKLGTMVSPVTFRHPSVLAKSATTVDHISGGRVELGMGAGWHVPEHRAFGFPFPPAPIRLQMLTEQVEIVHRQWTEDRVDFTGHHYTTEALNSLPRPVQKPHPNLIIGGSANRRSAELAAKWADEYNTVHVVPDECRARKQRVLDACERAGRSAGSMTFSLMTACIVGTDRADAERRAANVMAVSEAEGSPGEWLDSLGDAWIAGTVDEVVDRLWVFEEAGVERVMLQHLDHSDTDMVHLIGEEVVPRVS